MRTAGMPILARLERPEAVLLAIVLAVIAAVGWYGSALWLAVAVGAELVVAGIGAVLILGPARPGMGLARYATLSTAAVAATLLGRLLVDNAGFLLVVPATVGLWALLWAEINQRPSGGPGLLLDLVLVAIVFAAAAGVGTIVPSDAWPPGVLLLVLLVTVPALRTAEARGRGGVMAVGETVLHLFAVAQVAVVAALLGLPNVVGAALVALTYHAWGGAAEALDDGASAWAVLIEFGSLAVLGLVVALLLRGP